MSDAALSRPLLELDTVVKTFGGVTAVGGLSTRVTRGSVHGLIGPERRRQDDPDQSDHGSLPPDLRRDPLRGTLARGDAAAGDRHPRHHPHLSERPPVLGHDGARAGDDRLLAHPRGRGLRLLPRSSLGARRLGQDPRTCALAPRARVDGPSRRRTRRDALLRRTTPHRDRPRARLPAEAPASRRADRRHEPPGGDRHRRLVHELRDAGSPFSWSSTTWGSSPSSATTARW